MATTPAGAEAPEQKQKRRRRTVNRTIAFVLVADVLALLIVEINHADRPKVTKAGAGESTGVVVDQALARLAAQLPTAQTAQTAPAAQPARTGERSQMAGGVRITLQTFELPATATTAGAAPKGGTVFAAADIEACSSSGSSGASPIVAAERFRLELPDGTRIPAGAAAKSPALPATTIPKGQCVRGWTTFEVPQGKRAAFLVYAGTSELRWAL
jgi:hypothetical protein